MSKLLTPKTYCWFCKTCVYIPGAASDF